MKKLLLVFLILLIPAWAWATTYNVTCSGTITTALQNAINSAATDGDTINVGGGSCTPGTVNWTNKNITIQGQGGTGTIFNTGSTRFATITQTTTPASWRITGIKFTGTNPNPLIIINPAANGPDLAISGYRIDHNIFDYGSGAVIFSFYGVLYGLIDNNTFNSTAAGSGYEILIPAMCVNSDFTAPQLTGRYASSLPVTLGDENAIYFEDNTVNFTSPGTTGVSDGMYGSRVVVRHNTINGSYVYTHSARNSERGAKRVEVYNNIFTGFNFYRALYMGSGTGVVFNNTITGYQLSTLTIDDHRACHTAGDIGAILYDCNGSGAYDGNIEASGWPCVDQIGRGSGNPGSQTSLPLYAWKNGTTSTCATGGTCNNSVLLAVNGCASSYISSSAHSNGNVDYVENGSTPKPGYTAYTYPHPLQGGSSQSRQLLASVVGTGQTSNVSASVARKVLAAVSGTSQAADIAAGNAVHLLSGVFVFSQAATIFAAYTPTGKFSGIFAGSM